MNKEKILQIQLNISSYLTTYILFQQNLDNNQAIVMYLRNLQLNKYIKNLCFKRNLMLKLKNFIIEISIKIEN